MDDFLNYTKIKINKNAGLQTGINTILAIFCGNISLTYKRGYPIVATNESKVLSKNLM